MKEKDGFKRTCGHNLVISVAVLIVFMISGCYTEGPLFTRATLENPASSMIYIYRPDAECRGSKKIEFLVDSEQVVTLRGKEYSYVHVDPGEHLITSGELKKEEIPSLKIKITSEEGKSRYVQYKIMCEADYLIFNSTINLYLGGVPESKALSEMKSTTLTNIPNKKISKQEAISPE
jgi:hypothetical protein